MTIDERQRYHLHQTLEITLGSDAAATLMAYLPPVGWAGVATRHDLDGLAHQLRSEIAEVRTEIAGLRGEPRAEIAEVRIEIHRTLRTMTLTFVGATTAIVSTIAALTNMFG